jgi:phage protein D
MKPAFRILANEEDITDLIADRLISLRTTDKPGLESDECELTIDDRDNAVSFPKKGATLEVSLGYEGEELTLIGKYTIDEIEVSGPPQEIVIRAKPLDIGDTEMKAQRRHFWENVTLEKIVADIAQRSSLKPLCNVQADVPRADQMNESDMHFITRLARQHGATATIKDKRLIVAPRGKGESGSGVGLPEISFSREDLASYQLTFPDRSAYGAVSAMWHNDKTGKREIVHLPNPNGEDGPEYTERHIYPNATAAKEQAKSRVESLNRSTMSGKLELMRGRADVGSERWAVLEGIKPDVDGRYLVESVEHNFSRQAWITTVNLNAGNEGKSKVGKGEKKKGTEILRLPDAPASTKTKQPFRRRTREGYEFDPDLMD